MTKARGPGMTGAVPSGPPSNGPAFAHFDDIKQVKLDVDSVTPVETILSYAEGCVKQAEFMKDFGRLDMALKEYLKASIALLEVLPSNPAWMSVMTDRKGARVRYNSLMAQINAESATYEKIRDLIKEDNARTGVQPKNALAQNGQHRSAGSANGASVANRHSVQYAPTHQEQSDVLRSSATRASITSSPQPKSKPTIHPKPQSLAGTSVKSTSTSGSRSAQELAQRFANLRTEANAQAQPAQPVQDPRIRTQPINVLRVQPPASAPQQQQQNVQSPQTQSQNFQLPPPRSYETRTPMVRPGAPSKIHDLPDLPKVPDAIYSPARGSVSGQGGQIPTSTSMGMFNRTNSMNSFTGTAKPPSQAPEDYFSLSRTHSRQSSRPSQDYAPPRKPRVPIPEGDTISREDLLRFMQAGSKEIQILLIDIRSREEFDEGHIMSQATICVEAEILQRESISASQIADSMVLAPAVEMRLFDRRADFDLIVFYDEDSEQLYHNGNASSPTQVAAVGLYNALSIYDYDSESDGSRTPKLLKGGIVSWVAMMGTASLQTSSTLASTGVLTRAPAQRSRQRPRVYTRPQSKYMVKPIQDVDEAKRWEESLKDMEKSAVFRTTEDFLRRYPPVSAIQESMTSPSVTKDDNEIGFHSIDRPVSPPPYEARPASRATSTLEAGRSGPVQSSPAEAAAIAAATRVPAPPYPPPVPPHASATTSTAAGGVASTANLYSTLPVPPTRPPPTVPKPSHSNIAEADDEDHYMRTKMAKAGVTGSRIRRRKVGLYNPGNWCYGNSSFQSLFSSGTFAEELTTGEWANHWRVPMKSDEKISHPQLLAKILANSFHWMQFGEFQALKPKTLMDYCYHIHSRDYDGSIKTDKSTIFGGPYQQDAQEFISFLLENLHDETNRLRDRTGEVQQPPLDPRSTALGNAVLYWREYCRFNDSIVDRYWRGIEVTDRRCRSCGHPSLTYEHFDALHLPIPPNTATTATTMAELLGQYCGADILPEYKCDKCRRIDTTEKRVQLVRLPDLLCISFRRFQGNEYDGFRKNNTAVVFPVNGLDLTPYTVQGRMAAGTEGALAAGPDAAEHQFQAPFVYDCYAVIVHSGTLKSGHYRSFIKDEGAADTNQWYHFDDARVEPVTIGSGDSRDMVRRLYRDHDNGASAYMVFYKRRLS